MKKIEDEKILSALITCPTIREAAASVGCSDRTIYSRMRDGEFYKAYNLARTDILRGAVAQASGQVGKALQTISEIMMDKEGASPQVRLNAAVALLNHADKVQTRLIASEQATMPCPPVTELIDI